VVPVSAVVRVHGMYAASIRHAIGDAWIAESYSRAQDASSQTTLPVATADGDVFRGPHLVTGGVRREARGILETKREIKDLRARIDGDRETLSRLAEETARFDATIPQPLPA